MANGLSFNPSVNALGVYGTCLSVEALNVTAGSAVAGRTEEEFVTAFDMEGLYSGVESTTVRHLDRVGIPIEDATNTHFTITGQGYAITKDSTDPLGKIGYVRDGTFFVDKRGNVVNNLGQYLQVYAVTPNGVPVNPDISTATALQTLNVNNLVTYPLATTTIDESLQLPGAVAVGQPGSTYPQTITIYDSLGISHNLLFTWTKVGGPYANGAATQGWTLTITEPGTGAAIGGSYQAGSRIEFDASGAPLAFDTQGGGSNAANPPNLDIIWNNGALNSSVALNFGAVGSMSGVVSIGNTVIPGKISPDGHRPGAYEDLQIDKDGFVVGIFNNNTTMKCFRIPLAMFKNVNGLDETRPGVFNVSGDSGLPYFVFPGEGGSGTLQDKSVEGSSVNSIKAYTNMIRYQRDYVSNVKAIKVLEKMWDSVLEL